jgi:AraC-like DNA-binding protein
MEFNSSLIPLLYLLGTTQGIFLSLALFTSKAGNRIANRYLGALTLIFSASLADYVLDYSQLLDEYVRLRTLLWPRDFLFGTLLYFYVREMSRPGSVLLRGRQWLHFLPAFLHVLVTWPILFISPERQILIFDQEADDRWPDQIFSFLLGDFETFTAIFQLSIYFALSWRLLKQHRSHIKDNFSYADRVSLDWLRLLVVGIFSIYVIWVVGELISELFGLSTLVDILLGASMVVLIYGMGYLGLRQPLIFSRPVQTQKNSVEGVKSAHEIVFKESKYKNSPLTPDLSQALLDEARLVMLSEQAFLNPKLSLPELAEKLDVSVNYLSQIINEQAGLNFFEFVNSYRVEHAKKLLSQPVKMSILDVAMGAGFNSKSAFYTAFKKLTDMTPTEFRRLAKQDDRLA